MQDLALTLRTTGAAEQLEDIEAERDKLAVVIICRLLHPYPVLIQRAPAQSTWQRSSVSCKDRCTSELSNEYHWTAQHTSAAMHVGWFVGCSSMMTKTSIGAHVAAGRGHRC